MRRVGKDRLIKSDRGQEGDRKKEREKETATENWRDKGRGERGRGLMRRERQEGGIRREQKRRKWGVQMWPRTQRRLFPPFFSSL